ncbi:MAG TPA: hypothetical protein VHW46_00960 [Terracidiphilus sp.]|jgi:hypothetical protein|nr:hypothetical protein [Terracidiphilus sp.]
MLRNILLLSALGLGGFEAGSAQATVHVKSPDVSGTRALQEQTATAAIRNYLQAWEGFKSAFEQNRVDALDRDFIGTAKDKLSATVQQQESLGIRSKYQDKVHDIQIVFYSPDGLSLELIDDVEYNVQLIDHDKAAGSRAVKARYVTVMTPTETKWRVRVFQALPE